MLKKKKKLQKKNWVTQIGYTSWQYNSHSAPPCTEGQVLSLFLSSTCTRMEKYHQQHDLQIKKDNYIWQMIHHYVTSKEPQGHLTAHFLLKFPLRKTLQGYKTHWFALFSFFNSLSSKTQRNFLPLKWKSLTLKRPRTRPPEMTSGWNWDLLTKLIEKCYQHLNTVTVLSPFFTQATRETTFRIKMQVAYYLKPFLNITCKAYCNYIPLSPSQNQASYQSFIWKTKPETLSLPSQSSCQQHLLCVHRVLVDNTKETLILYLLGAHNRKDDDLYSIFEPGNWNAMMKRTWALEWDWQWCNPNSTTF